MLQRLDLRSGPSNRTEGPATLTVPNVGASASARARNVTARATVPASGFLFGQRVAARAGRGQLGAKRVDAPDDIRCLDYPRALPREPGSLAHRPAETLPPQEASEQPCLSGCRGVQHDLAAHRGIVPEPCVALCACAAEKARHCRRRRGGDLLVFGREPIEHTLSGIRRWHASRSLKPSVAKCRVSM